MKNAIHFGKLVFSISYFLYFPNGLDKAIRELKELSLEEKWYFGGVDTGKYPILKNYFIYTFSRLVDEEQYSPNKKLVISKDSNYALFNTGLVDSLYDPIYALFERNINAKRILTKWIFKCFTSTDLSSFLMKSFNYLPNSVKYYNSESELFFDESYEISFIDWSHLVDHCERLPLEFLKLNLPDYDFDCKHDKKFFEDLSTFLKKKENSKYLNRLKDNYESAFNLAKKKVKWNFKVAVPIYFARKRIITLLLPLDLTQDGHIDAAVALEAVSDKKLSIPHTIFSLKNGLYRFSIDLSP